MLPRLSSSSGWVPDPFSQKRYLGKTKEAAGVSIAPNHCAVPMQSTVPTTQHFMTSIGFPSNRMQILVLFFLPCVAPTTESSESDLKSTPKDNKIHAMPIPERASQRVNLQEQSARRRK